MPRRCAHCEPISLQSFVVVLWYLRICSKVKELIYWTVERICDFIFNFNHRQKFCNEYIIKTLTWFHMSSMSLRTTLSSFCLVFCIDVVVFPCNADSSCPKGIGRYEHWVKNFLHSAMYALRRAWSSWWDRTRSWACLMNSKIS